MLLPALSGVASASVTVPTNAYFSMPTLGTMFNFASEQVIGNEPYRSLYSNVSYPEFWFFTTESGETYGLQATTNFTVSTLFSSQTLVFATHGFGVVKAYCRSLGAPVSVSGASKTYDAVSNVASFTVLSASTVTVSWVAPPPPPTPPVVSVTINQPTSAT